MKVQLISYSKTSYSKTSYSKTAFTGERESEDTLQDLVAYCARVSNPANQHNKETNEKLIHYLIKNNHWSPLEMVSICLEIETTRDIARQILRHRSFSFQEFSQRYAVADLGFQNKEARTQDTKNRQNSIQTDDVELQNAWLEKQNAVNEASSEAYKWALENGIAKEQARSVLPEGTTLSRLYMNGTLRSWVHYIQLRSGNGTQKEHKDVAIACANAIHTIFPMINEFISE
jgi:thymidylate synthase (FAD)